MTVAKHMKIAGALQIVQGSILLLGFASYLVAGVLDFRSDPQKVGELSGLILILAVLFLLGVGGGGLQVWFGCSLAMQKRWATRVFGFILCILGLVVFPFGLVFNGYTLWVLVQVNKKEAGMTDPAG